MSRADAAPARPRPGSCKLLAEGLDAAAADAEIPDRRLALMFACAHPAIEAGIRAPLMLQVVLGLDAKTIASAFLMSPAAMGKRLVRAKDKIRQAGIPFQHPGARGASRPARHRAGRHLRRLRRRLDRPWRDRCRPPRSHRGSASFWPGCVTELLPEEPEALGLLALMLHAEARRRARRNGDGEYVPLAEQDPALWDWQMIEEAEALLRRASALGSIGRYQLEGALQSAHVYRRRTGHANWAEVVQLYDALFALAGSPVVAINRALAIAEMHGASSRPRGDARGGRRCAARRIPTLLGGARGAAGQDRRTRRGPPRLRDRDRSRARPRGPPLPAAASVGLAGMIFLRAVD